MDDSERYWRTKFVRKYLAVINDHVPNASTPMVRLVLFLAEEHYAGRSPTVTETLVEVAGAEATTKRNLRRLEEMGILFRQKNEGDTRVTRLGLNPSIFKEVRDDLDKVWEELKENMDHFDP